MTPDVEIDLAALCANFAAMAAASAPAEPAAVVKCDAYGLGMGPVAAALYAKTGCRTFFVAYPEEGRRLRAVVDDATIYVFHGVTPSSLGAYRAAGLIPVLNSLEQARLWASAAPGVPAALHVDTGMNRLGVRVNDLPAVAGVDGLFIDLVLSHFAISENPAAPSNRAQARAFQQAAAECFPAARRSLAASATALASPGDGLDLVRLGVGLYGVAPLDQPDVRIRPVATLRAEVLQTSVIPPGETAGYGRMFSAIRETRTATLGLGYGDGFPRAGSGRARAFVGGAACPMIGRVSMDLIIVDVTDAPATVAPGDRAEIFGPRLSIDDQAAACGTIGYELLTGLGPRIVRRYVWNKEPVETLRSGE